MIRIRVLVLTLLAACTLDIHALETALNETPRESVKPAFKEIWAYLMRGEEKELTGLEPITDICYFGVNLTREGRIADTVSRPVIVAMNGSKPRVHLVIAELSNYSLMHFSLDPQYGVRPLLVADICRVAEGFDGVQIDFECVSGDDAAHFFDFLRELKGKLPAGKSLSVALPARTEAVSDAYDYTKISPIVDRLVIMAYDEHWSTSAPGPVASLPWCSKVVDFVQSAADPAKIIMGLPLYGRAWPDKKLSRALRFKNVQDLLAETKSTTSYASDLGAYFEYSEEVTVTVFYDDARTIMEKLQLYRAKNISAVSFWRVGQGPPQLWSSIAAAQPAAMPPAAAASQTSAAPPPAASPAVAAPTPVPPYWAQ
jgi:spore germination protein